MSIIKGIIGKLITTNSSTTSELKNTAENVEYIIESESNNPEGVKKTKFLIGQIVHNDA